MSPWKRISALVLCIVFAAAGLVAEQQPAPSRDPRFEQTQRVSSMEELAPRTVADAAIAKVFSGGSPMRPGVVVFPEIARGIAVPEPRAKTAEDALRWTFCTHDAVFLGTPISRRVLATSDRSALVTVFTVRAERWLWPVQGPIDVTVGFFGGRAIVDGQLYEARQDGEHAEFQLQNPSLFVFRAIGSGAYLSSRFSAPAPVGGKLVTPAITGPTTEVLATLQRELATCGQLLG